MEEEFKKELEKLLEMEMEDYGISTDVEYQGVTASVNFSHLRNSANADFRYTSERKLEIDMYDDNWEEVDYYSWRVKYLWIKLADLFVRKCKHCS